MIFKGTKRNGIYVTKAIAVLPGPVEASSAEIDTTLKWQIN